MAKSVGETRFPGQSAGALIRRVFAGILGKPSWIVRKGLGSIVIMHFGSPSVCVHEPRSRPGRTRLSDFPISLTRRQAWVEGEWQLWILYCRWIYTQDGERVVESSSGESRIGRCIPQLQGQALKTISLGAGVTRFEFDFGGLLEVRKGNIDMEKLWKVHTPSRRVFVVRSDGMHSYDLGSMPLKDVRWMPLPEKPLVVR
jgi:hypothetical protein